MERKTILLCDLSQDDVRSTGFLLELAGYRVYSVRCLEEAVNWISVYQGQADSLSLILVAGSWPELKDSPLLETLCREQRRKPILVFDPTTKQKKALSWEEGQMTNTDLSHAPVWGVVSLVKGLVGNTEVMH